jgi:hypothetical protein
MNVSELIADLQKYGGNEQVGIWRPNHPHWSAAPLTPGRIGRLDPRFNAIWLDTEFADLFPHGAVMIR